MMHTMHESNKMEGGYTATDMAAIDTKWGLIMSINQTESKKLVYTVKEIATMLEISVRSAYNLCNETKDFKVIKLSEKSVRINKESFDQWFFGL